MEQSCFNCKKNNGKCKYRDGDTIWCGAYKPRRKIKK